MSSTIITRFHRHFSAGLRFFIPFLATIILFNLITLEIWAQGFTRQINVLINKDVIETFTFEDENGNPLGDEQIIAEVDSMAFAALEVLNPGEGDTPVDTGGILTVKTDANGQETFVIKGVSEGLTTITFTTADGLDIEETVAVNAIGVEARIIVNPGTFGDAPLELIFTDVSGETVTERDWDFDGGDIINGDNDDQEVTVEFNNEGLFNVSLEITGSTGIGTVTSRANQAICVFPESTSQSTIVIGNRTFGSIHGVVFRADNNLPIVGAHVNLVGGTRKVKLTNTSGAFNFRVVRPGPYTIFACANNFNCDDQSVIVTESSVLSVNFDLVVAQ